MQRRDPVDRRAAGLRPRTTSPAALVAICVGVAIFVWTGAAGRTIDHLRSRPQPSGASLATGLPPRDDPWGAFLAPETICPGRTDASGSPAVQQTTVVCLLNYAREHVGLAALPSSAEISGWSASKAADIKRCDDFSHSPCDEAADRYPRTAGFTGAFGENIFMGPQEYKTPLAAVDGWLNSQAHRENLFRTNWRAQGVAVLHTNRLRDQRDVAIWVSEFAT